MKRLIIVLVVLVGCTSSQHKHPHDHGLSSLRGDINRVSFNVGELRHSLREVGLELMSARGGLAALEDRTKKVEAYKKRLAIAESDLLELERHIEAFTALYDKKLAEQTKNIVTLDDEHRHEVTSVRSSVFTLRDHNVEIRKRLKELEEKIKLQKLIETRPEEKKEEVPEEKEEVPEEEKEEVPRDPGSPR